MAGRSAVFLDRDGVINERRFFLVRRHTHFEFRPDTLTALARLARSEHAIVVATNQPVVGYRLMPAEDLAALHATMVREIEAAGGRVDLVKVCTYGFREDPPCRKPKPGMLVAAAEELGLDLARSWMVGDQEKDLLAARAAGVRGILVNPTPRARLVGAARLADAVAANLSGAVDRILSGPVASRRKVQGGGKPEQPP